MRRRIIYSLFAGMSLLVSIFSFVLFYLFHLFHTPISKTSRPVLIEITEGMDFDRMINLLEKEGLAPYPLLYKIMNSIYHYEKRIKFGEYLLNASLSPSQIIDKLVRGEIYLHRVTVPEGLTAREIASILQKEAIIDHQEEFIQLCGDKEFLKSVGINAEYAEGYLFPDTYFFRKRTGAKNVLLTMFRNFFNKFNNELIKQAEKNGLTLHQALTLASLIEKETAIELERPLISSVFHNRLKKGMFLQCDPSIIYVLKEKGEYDGNLTRSHLVLNHPYNTYKFKGLPPGPISNPGLSSIKAACNPPDTKYLYFVSKGDGSHFFSATLQEHNKAVSKYQLKKD